jgi:hypothetical protein
MSTHSSPQRPHPIIELRAGTLRLVVERIPYRLLPPFGVSGPGRAADPRGANTEGARDRRLHRRLAKTLAWRAALGAAYALGTGAVALAEHWIMTSV